MKRILHIHWPALLVMFIAVVIALTSFKDYGITWDECWQRDIGHQYYTYMHGNNPGFNNYLERDHGSGFEVPLIYIENWFKLTDSRDIFLMRHLVNHCFFLLCMFIGYIFIYRTFKNKWLAVAALIALVFHPRIYAHSYFNTKDIPAMSTFLLSMAAGLWALEKKKIFPFIVLGIVCGYSASIRLMNVFIIVPLFILLIADVIKTLRSKQGISNIILGASAGIITFCITLYICWPTLWGNPVHNLVDAYKSLSNFRFTGEVLFNGTVYAAGTLPWNYIITWVILSTPELLLILALVGTTLLLTELIRQPYSIFTDERKRLLLVSFICFFTPILIVELLDSVLYDDWRHMYFIYPAFVFIAVYGLHTLLSTHLKKVVAVLFFAQVALTGFFFIQSHPYQQVYFNRLISHKPGHIGKLYEMEYWGASNKEALEWVLANDTSDTISIFNMATVNFNRLILPEEQRNRLSYTSEMTEADYYIQNYRTLPFWDAKTEIPTAQVVHEVEVLNCPIIRITKLK